MSRLAPIALALLLGSADASFAQQFVVDGQALPPQSLWTDGVEIADVDGDGWPDILFANGQGYGQGGALQQHLFLNNAGGQPGVFQAAHQNLGVAPFNAKMVIAEDFDLDGDLDLMYAPEGKFPNPTEVPRYLQNDGTGVFTDVSATRLPQVKMASFCVCAGDIDDDGDLDVVFTDGATFSGIASQAHLFRNDGSGAFADITASHMPNDLYNAQDVVLFDWDGDFDIDIALSGKGSSGKRSRLYLNDGSGHFSISTVLDSVGTGGTYEIDWGDLDGDGDLDGLVQSIQGFQEGWARNDGTSVQKSVFPSPNGADDNEMAALDYDQDGDLDVFIGSLGPTERAYRNDGGGSFVNVNSIIQAQGDSTLDLAFADLDGDRDYDMVTAQGESGNFTNKVYRNTGARDTRPPTLLALEDQPPFQLPRTIFHARVRDAVQDDGHVNVAMRYVYATADGNGGLVLTGTARRQGGGTFRAQATMPAGTTAVSLAWIAEDSAGNETAFGPVGAGAPNVWSDLGQGLGGALAPPALVGIGTLLPNSAGALLLAGARPNVPAFLFVGSGVGQSPFLGGTFVPLPLLLQIGLTTNADGELLLPFTWPAGVPTGTFLTMQVLVAEPTAPQGHAFSNAVALTSP